jgi:transposase
MEMTSRDLGIDFHSDRFTVDYFEGAHHRKKTFELKNREAFFEELRPTDHITIEAMTGTFAFVREIGNRVENSNIVNPAKFNNNNSNRNKTDSIDAKMLAEAGRSRRHNVDDRLARVYLVTERISELRSLVAGYQLLVAEMTALKNRIHAILKDTLNPFNGENICLPKNREKIDSLQLSEGYKFQIQTFFKTLDFLETQKENMAEAIKGYAKYFERDVRFLISIPGVSILIAMALIADYADISRFKNSKHFCSYLRTAPGIDQSNESTKIKHINKSSRKYALAMLLQGLSHTWQNEGRIKGFRDRKKNHNMNNGKLRIAISRKIMVSMFYMVKKGECYNEMNPKNYEKKQEELKKYL